MKDFEKLIAEARRWANGHHNRRSGEMVGELVDALEKALGERPTCSDHRLVQHRDGKPPWCRSCGRAAVPDAATEPNEPKDLSIMNGWLVEYVGEHTCGTGPDGHYGAHEPGCGYVPELNLADLDGWPGAERDAAVAAIERVRELHQPMWYDGEQVCDFCYGEGYEEYRSWPCDTRRALDGAPEPEWEDGVRYSDQGAHDRLCGTRERAESRMSAEHGDVLIRRTTARHVPAGPWLPVEGESKP